MALDLANQKEEGRKGGREGGREREREREKAPTTYDYL